MLKARSPSCSMDSIHDGTFKGMLKPGFGITAALLTEHGIHIFDESRLQEAAGFLATLKAVVPS